MPAELIVLVPVAVVMAMGLSDCRLGLAPWLRPV